MRRYLGLSVCATHLTVNRAPDSDLPRYCFKHAGARAWLKSGRVAASEALSSGCLSKRPSLGTATVISRCTWSSMLGKHHLWLAYAAFSGRYVRDFSVALLPISNEC